MPAIQVEHYLRRATDFLEGMKKLTRTDPTYPNSAALLAIHAAVSYSDALRCGLGETKLSSDDHRTAADSLQKLISKTGSKDQTGLEQFRKLIAKKHHIAYGSTRFDHSDYETLFTRAERFAQWADNLGNRLRIEGWRYGDQ